MNESPSALRDLQAWFQSAMTDSQATTHEPAQQILTASSKQTAAERLAVYQRAYFARLAECLKAMFPASLDLLGEDAFEGLALAYLRAHPPSSYTLNALPDQWVVFLRASRPAREDAALDWADFLIDLATLEQAIDEVFDGPGAEGLPKLSIAGLAQLSPQQAAVMRMTLAPCVRLLAFQFPVNDYYTQFRQQTDASLPLPAPAATHLLLHRTDYVVQRLPLTTPQYQLLTKLQSGEPLEAAIEKTIADSPQAIDDITAQLHPWFREWSAAGIFLAIQ